MTADLQSMEYKPLRCVFWLGIAKAFHDAISTKESDDLNNPDRVFKERNIVTTKYPLNLEAILWIYLLEGCGQYKVKEVVGLACVWFFLSGKAMS